MKSSGTNQRKLISNRKFLCLLTAWILAANPSIASEDTCARLRAAFDSGGDEKKSLEELSFQIAKGSLCAKNLLGVLYAKGGVINRDVDHAFAIFHDLS